MSSFAYFHKHWQRDGENSQGDNLRLERAAIHRRSVLDYQRATSLSMQSFRRCRTARRIRRALSDRCSKNWWSVQAFLFDRLDNSQRRHVRFEPAHLNSLKTGTTLAGRRNRRRGYASRSPRVPEPWTLVAFLCCGFAPAMEVGPAVEPPEPPIRLRKRGATDDELRFQSLHARQLCRCGNARELRWVAAADRRAGRDAASLCDRNAGQTHAKPLRIARGFRARAASAASLALCFVACRRKGLRYELSPGETRRNLNRFR